MPRMGATIFRPVHAHLWAAAILSVGILVGFRYFGNEARAARTGENQKSNESAAILVQVLEVSSISRCGFVSSKSREIATSQYMVWPPPINGRAERTISRKIVGCNRLRKARAGSDRTRNSLSFVPCTDTFYARSQAKPETPRKSEPSESEAIP